MRSHKFILALAVLLAVVAVSVWGALAVGSANGASTADQPMVAGNARASKPNQPAATGKARASNQKGRALAGNAAGDDENGEGQDDSDGSITPAEAESAKAAALKIAGGGTVKDVEKGDDGNPGWFEVEVRKADGTEVKVQLDENFNPRQGREESGAGDNDQEGADDD